VLSFNGTVPGPTLYLQPGDRLRIELVNRLHDPTNLHTHGLHVSPQDNGDNPFVTIEPGGSHRYDIQLPDDHPPGHTRPPTLDPMLRNDAGVELAVTLRPETKGGRPRHLGLWTAGSWCHCGAS